MSEMAFRYYGMNEHWDRKRSVNGGGSPQWWRAIGYI